MKTLSAARKVLVGRTILAVNPVVSGGQKAYAVALMLDNGDKAVMPLVVAIDVSTEEQTHGSNGSEANRAALARHRPGDGG